MIYFLSGLPRTGSTLLCALLSQRGDIHVSATSGLIDLLGAVVQGFESMPTHENSDKTEVYRLLNLMVTHELEKYPGRHLINKSRGWPNPVIMETMSKVLNNEIKIIATVRPIVECLTSAIKITGFNGNPKDFINNSPLAAHIFSSYQTLKAGYEKNPRSFLFIEYDNLVSNPQYECDRIADFLQLERFTHKFNELVNPVPENDAELWKIPGLHDIRATINKESSQPIDVLGKYLTNFYSGGKFWSDKVIAEAPDLLKIQCDAAWQGDFDFAESITALTDPEDDRAAYNSGFYLLRKGELQKGMRAMERGFNVNAFGNQCTSGMPRWNGENLNHKTVLLHLEGGYGDQIWGVRWVRDLENRGAKVILSGNALLAEMLSEETGCNFIEHQAAGGIFHHYYAPAMRLIPALGYEYQHIDGTPYLNKYKLHKRGNKLRVGIRWSGNPQFEHEQKRTQDPQWMFSLHNDDIQLVNLQKDADIDIPEYVERPQLTNWSITQRVISTLDLVITSCTSIAHLAGAMGIKTWVIVPILPYFLWAQDKETTEWYNSVRIFRQRQPNNWDIPRQLIEQALDYESNKIRNGNVNRIA